MPYQSQSNAYAAYKVQSGLGTQATGASAKVLRLAGGPGGRLAKAAVESQEVRRDGQRSRGRHGVQKSSGSYATQLSIGEAEDILQAVTRGTYSAANTTVTEATSGGPTSITTTTSTIVGNTGSWITAGIRVGEVWRLTGHATAANNNKNLLVTGVTATVITVAGTPLTADAVADITFTLTRTGRKLILPAAGSLVERYWTIEEHDVDIDASEIWTDAKWGMVRYQMQPNGIVMQDFSWVGTGQYETKTGASAPHFTSPSESTGLPLAVADASLYVNGAAVVDLTGFDISLDIKLQAPDTFGSAAAKYAPDVFSGQAAVSLNLSMLRKDLTAMTDFNAETQWSLLALMVENEAEPKDFHLIHVPNFTIGGVDKSALSREGGPRTITIQVPEALVGKDDAGGAYDASMIKFQVSTAS